MDVTHLTEGRVYWAPTSLSSKSPLIPGEARGFLVDLPSQQRAVVYTSRELAEAAFYDERCWHPRLRPRFQIRAVRYTNGRFVWAPEAE